MTTRSTEAPRVVRCPQCGAPVPWTVESKWRPFCSERCKTIDLAAWASERYRVETSEGPGEPEPGGLSRESGGREPGASKR